MTEELPAKTQVSQIFLTKNMKAANIMMRAPTKVKSLCRTSKTKYAEADKIAIITSIMTESAVQYIIKLRDGLTNDPRSALSRTCA